MEKIAIFLVLGFIASSCGKNHQITGEIDGLGNDTLLVQYAPVAQFYEMDEFLVDTILATGDKFSVDFPAKEPVLAFIFPKKAEFKRLDGSLYYPEYKYLILLIEPDDQIRVRGTFHEYYLAYEAKGSDFNRDYSQLREGYIEEISQAVKIELQLDTLMSKGGDRELINKLFKKRNEIKSIANENELEYLKNNWDRDLSAYYLTRQKLDSVGKYYENLNLDIKNGIFKNMLERQYQRYQKIEKVRLAEKKIVEGKTAPDFSLQSLSGEDFALSSIEDKYVVLDFWGSWCGWCIKGFPKMKAYYEKYNNELEIVGIACNDTEEKWRKSIDKYQLDWQHVINDNDIDEDVAVLYGIRGYPTKIILDKDKKIVAKFIGETDDFYHKLDALLRN